MSETPSGICYAPVRRGRQITEKDTLAPYYIISRGENAGFVIVSGDECLPEIIGYTDVGDFEEEQMPPALLDMLAGYAQLVEEAQEAGAPARVQRKVVAGRINIEPIIKTHWHQSSPYNDLAPVIANTTNKAVTGCTCTAAVMVLHHFRRDLPGELLTGTPTYDYGDAPVTVSYPKGTPILWDLMQNNYNGDYPAEMRNAVAVLNAAFGAGIWQTYGSSTSGQISNIVDGYNRFFNLSSVCQYKDGTSQSSWESLIYGNLIKGQPIVYAGVHPTNGGHAIILDGYNASNGLFHFNFGWGGQGDGYYTLDDETGVNGFSGQQGMVYNISPKKPNVSAKLHVEPQAFRRVETTIRVTATNHGTLDYSGFNLYWGTSNRIPSSSTSVSESNTSLLLSSDESGEFTVSFKPSSKRTYYVYLTDKNYNILDKAEIAVETVQPKLSLESFEISASSLIEEHGGKEFRLLHNDKLFAAAKIANAVGATPLQTDIRMGLVRYDETASTISTEKNITVGSQKFNPGEVVDISTTIDGLEAGLYSLCIKSRLSYVENDETLQSEGVDTLICFKVCAPSLDSISVVGTAMTLKGEWDALRFKSLAADPSITVYDLTEVSGISNQPVAANPNALFITSGAVKGTNIIYNGVCEELCLQPGYDFAPVNEFMARKATFTPQWNIDQGWYPFSLPFTVEKPEGYICRRVVAVSSSAISQMELTDTLYAYTPYMVMTCNNRPIVAANVSVSANGLATPDSVPAFCAIVSEAYAKDSILVYSYDAESSTQYFTKVEEGTRIEPFTAVIKSGSRRVRAHRSSSPLEKNYVALAQAINKACIVYTELHPKIEEEWNALLVDSMDYACSIYTAMQEESAAAEVLALRLSELSDRYSLKLADIDSPICYNSQMVNPSFEMGNKEGWSMEGNVKFALSTNLYSFSVDMDGKYLLYNEPDGTPYGIRQTIYNLPVGYYRLTALANSGEEGAVSLFAGNNMLAVEVHPWGKYYLAEHVIDSVWVDTDSLTIGLQGSNSWCKVDNFSLYYLGKGDNIIDGIDQFDANPPTFIPRGGIYDLFGRRIRGEEEMIQGTIYIVDGRKTVYRKE